MSDQFWVGDAYGRVMGPAPLKVVAELIARGRLKELTRASTDGKTFRPIEQVPLLARLLTGASPEAPQALLAEAERLEGELKRLRALAPKQRLGAPDEASADACRGAFFATVKRFHPSRLPAGAPERLQQAFIRMSELLAATMEEIERAERSSAPSYASESFVGWHEELDGTIRVELDVGPADAHLFHVADHEAFFLPSREVLPLLQLVEVKLRFKTYRREVKAHGRVVAANPQGKTGMDIRLIGATPDDRKFLQYFVRKYEARRQAR